MSVFCVHESRNGYAFGGVMLRSPVAPTAKEKKSAEKSSIRTE